MEFPGLRSIRSFEKHDHYALQRNSGASPVVLELNLVVERKARSLGKISLRLNFASSDIFSVLPSMTLAEHNELETMFFVTSE